MEKCRICRREIAINPHGYTPPIVNRFATMPVIQDEGVWYDGYRGKAKINGYVCTKCFGKVKWDKEDKEMLINDWGYDPDDPLMEEQI